MSRRQAFAWSGIFLALILPLAVAACAPAPEPTAAPPEPTIAPPATTTAPVEPVATTAVAAPTVAVVSIPAGKERGSIQPIPVLLRPPPNPQARSGGTYRIADSTWQADFSGWEGASGEATVSMPWVDTLLEYNHYEADKGAELLPNLAYDWWVSADGETWTFKLVEGAKFEDGVEFTCADAKFMIDAIHRGHDDKGSELRRSPRGQYLARVREVRCPDSHTLAVDTDGPLPSLPSIFAFGYFQVRAKHVFEGNLPGLLDAVGPSIGPFVVTERIQEERLVYKRNTNFWNQPYPFLDGITRTIVGSSAAQYSAFRVGRAEVGAVPSGQTRFELERGFFKEVSSSSHGGGNFQVNFRRQPWADPRMAQALRCAIDNEKFVRTARDGFALAHMGIWPPDSPWALPLERVRAIHPCLDDRIPMAERQKLGRQLMAEMGFTEQNPAKPYIMVWSALADWWPPYQDDLAKVNIVPSFQFLPTARSYPVAYAGEFDMIPWGFITPRFDADTWLSEHYNSNSDRNYGKYNNPEVDGLIDQQSRTLDPQKRLDIVWRIEEILLHDNAKVMTHHYRSPSFVAPWVIDFHFVDPSTGSTTYKFQNVWIDQKKLKELGSQ